MKVTDRPEVAFLSAIVGAFVAGIGTLLFLQNMVDQRVPSAIERLYQEGKVKLPRGPVGPPGPAVGMLEPIDVVIATPNVKGSFYVAPPHQVQEHRLQVSVPVGHRLLATWYVPVDAVPNLVHFDHVETNVGDRDTIVLAVRGKPNVDVPLRLYIYGIYGPERESNA